MTNAPRYVTPYAYAYDPTGEPIPEALLYFFLGDSSTAAATYFDAGLTVPNTNPVAADATGTFPAIFLDPSLVYKAQLYYPPADGSPPPAIPTGLVQIWSAYPIGGDAQGNLSSYSATGANAIVLAPFNGTPAISAYEDYQQFLFLAPSTTTGDVTIQVEGLAILPLYAGASQEAAGSLIAGQLVVAVYTSSVNGSGIPAMVQVNASPVSPILTAPDVGAANAYVLTPSPVLQAYSDTQIVLLAPANTNTGPSTLNISGLGAVQIGNQAGNPIGPGALVAGGSYLISYNGTTFQLLNPTAANAPTSGLQGTAPGGAQSATYTARNIAVTDASGNRQATGAVTLAGNLTSAGANGLDAGSVAANTWYAVFAIYGTTTALLFSLSASAPTLPTGYEFMARIGWVRTDGSSDILAFDQRGSKTRWINTGSGLRQMASGSAGSDSGTYVAVPVAAYAPSTAILITLSAFSNNSATGVAPNNNYGAFGSATNPPPVQITVGTQPASMQADLLLESANIYWFSSTSAGALYGVGYEDAL